jgi:hypothetical protein
MTFRSRFASIVAVGSAALLFSVAGIAQQAEEKRDEQKRERRDTTGGQTLTGCLNKGDTAGEYTFTDSATGQKKNVTASSGVDLAKHAANHTVKLTGTVSDDGQTMTVTKLEHVSATCDASK